MNILLSRSCFSYYEITPYMSPIYTAILFMLPIFRVVMFCYLRPKQLSSKWLLRPVFQGETGYQEKPELVHLCTKHANIIFRFMSVCLTPITMFQLVFRKSNGSEFVA